MKSSPQVGLDNVGRGPAWDSLTLFSLSVPVLCALALSQNKLISLKKEKTKYMQIKYFLREENFMIVYKKSFDYTEVIQ